MLAPRSEPRVSHARSGVRAWWQIYLDLLIYGTTPLIAKNLRQEQLCGVVGVDVDVLRGQVGSPEDATARALVKVDGDGELDLGNIGVSCDFIELGGAATVAADGQFTEPYIDAVGVDLRAGVADGCRQTAPVGIATGPGGFDQGRMRDGFGNAKCIGIAGGTLDVELDDMGDTVAVGDDLTRERGANLGERGGKGRVAGADGSSAGSRGEQEHGVVG